MSDAAFRFLSWVRRGAATRIAVPDHTSDAPRTTLTVDVEMNAGTHVASVSLEVHGPGDVIAFDARGITRVWPPAGTLDAEPNYFPLVELDQVDLPWRYTPRSADAMGRLRPWFTLIVVREDEVAFEAPRADRPLAKATIAAGTPMPAIDQTWAWAHVQIAGDDATPLDAALAQPGRCLARLLAPRRLDPSTRYWGMCVPIFEVGRRAGLRLPLVTTLEPAWTLTDGKLADGIELPVYYRWQFGTGVGGDFESLVRLLVPRELPPTIGLRSLDATQPGCGLPAASASAMPLGGALTGPRTVVPPWSASERLPFVTELGKVLDLPAEVRTHGGTPVVAPPLYGTWHARRDRLGTPPWFAALNEDPRNRIAGGLGTQVVQAQQQTLMESAWLQVAGIRELNARLRAAQLARALGDRLHARVLRSADAETVMTLTSAVHGRIRAGSKTVRALAQASPLRQAIGSLAFRRVFRPLGPIGRRQGRPNRAPAPVVTRVNTGAYDGVLRSTPPAANRLPTHAWLASQRIPWSGPPTATKIAREPGRPRAVVTDPIFDRTPSRLEALGTRDSVTMGRFREAAIAHAKREQPRSAEVIRRLDLSALRTQVVAALDPKLAIEASFQNRIKRRADFIWNPPDPIEPVMAHPEFPQPMYAPLASISPDWILPGLADVPANSVSLALTNPPFIEAFMVGLNHEMSRELLWNEYPTDQRGSYFRQFWDTTGLAPIADIRPIHEWPAGSTLGEHSPRPAPPDPNARHVVLLVRGELLRRYPTTLVYAQRAQGPIGGRTLADEQRAPLFSGRLDPDVAFFGFDLSKEQARGSATDPGWFFVFQEQPSEPRFGLDVSGPPGAPTSWNDLAWTHLAEQTTYIDLGTPLPQTDALEHPGGPAWHLTPSAPGKPFARGSDHAAITLQRPVRVAFHAAEMLS
jgi:hypothetical protein